jgi:dolichol-phosphate mannosyltransferase
MFMRAEWDVAERSPRLLSVIIPVFNEASSIEQVIRNVQGVALPIEIIVVDDGSTDGTDRVLRGLAAIPGLTVLRHQHNRGKGAAIRTALTVASGEFVVIQDADLEYDPRDLPALAAPLMAGETDVAYGVRRTDCAARGLMLFFGARMLTVLTNLLYGCRIHDEATCYKAFRRSLLDRITLERDGFDFCPEVTAKVCRLGERICEVPISYSPRAASEGKKLRLRDGFDAVAALLRYRVEPRDRFDRALAAAPKNIAPLPLAIASIVTTLIALGSSLWFAKTRYFDRDEFEHLHFAWCITRGMVPYRDFFEHHTPWFHFLLAATMPLYQVDRRFGDALSFIWMARRFDLALGAIAIALTFMLARLWRGTGVGWIAIALLATSPIFAHKAIEIRPDILALVLWLGCLLAIVRALNVAAIDSRRRAMLFALSGGLLGGAVMCTQKLLMAMPPLALAMAWYVAAGAGERQARMRDAAILYGGLAAPVIATMAYFWYHGALRAAFEFNLFLNLHWKLHLPASRLIRKGLGQDAFLIGFGFLGLVWEASGELRQCAFSPGKLLIVVTAGLIAGLWEMPLAREQYELTFLPPLAVFAGAFMLGIADGLRAEYLGGESRRRRCLVASIALIVAIIAIAAKEPLWLKICSAVVMVLASALMLTVPGEVVIAAVLCALCVPPYWATHRVLTVDNAATLGTLRYVIEETAPTDTFMDRWTGIGVFRPHAYFYWFLHEEIVAMLTEGQHEQMLADLQSGKIAPRYIVADDWDEVSDRIPEFLLSNYRPVPGEPALWEPKALRPDLRDRTRGMIRTMR